MNTMIVWQQVQSFVPKTPHHRPVSPAMTRSAIAVKAKRIAAVLQASALTLPFLLTPSPSAGAVKDLGTVGNLYEIGEPNVLTELQARASQVDTDKNQESPAYYQPKNLYRLPKATHNRTIDVDMRTALKQPVKDGGGRILYPAGFTYNPLHYWAFVPGLVIIDGSDPNQIDWYEKSPYFDNKGAMLLVSDGYAFELVEKFKRPVYYLTEKIATRLRLAAVPAIIVGEGDALKVREVKID